MVPTSRSVPTPVPSTRRPRLIVVLIAMVLATGAAAIAGAPKAHAGDGQARSVSRFPWAKMAGVTGSHSFSEGRGRSAARSTSSFPRER